ncbi:MAG: hypothetical protein JJE46_16085 [Acidimicrobiia bacterium]|nr:hypothetical protein [Acidimicrobiia bacterium]
MLRLVASAAVLIIALAACGSDAKVRTTDDGKITVTGSGKKARVNIQSDTSDLTFNQTKLPKDFPGDVPLPKGWKRMSAISGRAGGHPLFQITYSIGREPAATTIAAYEQQLTSSGFTVDRAAGSSSEQDGIVDMSVTGHGWQVSAAGLARATPHIVVVSVQPA